MGLLFGLWIVAIVIVMGVFALGDIAGLLLPMLAIFLLVFPITSHIHQSERMDEIEKQLDRMEQKLDQLLEKTSGE